MYASTMDLLLVVLCPNSIDDKVTEHIVHLGIENSWMGDRENYTMLLPSAYNIDAWKIQICLLFPKSQSCVVRGNT